MRKFISNFFKYFLVLGLIFSCKNEEKSSENLSIASQEYAVLAEKTICYQADFDLDSWAEMLADDVQFEMPDYKKQSKSAGKSAAIKAWSLWKVKHNIQSLKCSRFSQIPVKSNKTMRFSDLSGVFVFSLVDGTFYLKNGKTTTLKMSYWVHFNQAKLIDRYYAYYDLLQLAQI